MGRVVLAYKEEPILTRFAGAAGGVGSQWTFNTSELQQNGSNFLVYTVPGTIRSDDGYWNAETFGPDCEVYLFGESYVTGGTGTGLRGGVIDIGLRSDATYSNCYYLRYTLDDTGTKAWQLRKVVASVDSLLASGTDSLYGDSNVGIQARGSTIDAFHYTSVPNLLASVSDSSITGAGYLFLRISNFNNGAGFTVGWNFGSSGFGGGTLWAPESGSNYKLRTVYPGVIRR